MVLYCIQICVQNGEDVKQIKKLTEERMIADTVAKNRRKCRYYHMSKNNLKKLHYDILWLGLRDFFHFDKS